MSAYSFLPGASFDALIGRTSLSGGRCTIETRTDGLKFRTLTGFGLSRSTLGFNATGLTSAVAAVFGVLALITDLV